MQPPRARRRGGAGAASLAAPNPNPHPNRIPTRARTLTLTHTLTPHPHQVLLVSLLSEAGLLPELPGGWSGPTLDPSEVNFEVSAAAGAKHRNRGF